MTSPIDRRHSNRRMSKVVVQNDTVYLCAQVGNRSESNEAQCAEAFRGIDGLLAEAGTSNERVLLVEFTVTAAR